MKLHRIRYQNENGCFIAWEGNNIDAKRTVQELKDEGATDISVAVLEVANTKADILRLLNSYADSENG